MGFFSEMSYHYSNYATTNMKNCDLAVLNGSVHLKDGYWKNILINGHAKLGSESTQTIFEGIVIVNGNAKVISTSFDIFEVNGNLIINKGTINQTLEVFGNAELFSVTAQNLILKGKKYLIKDSTIKGDITWQGMGSKNNKLILDNSIILGKINYQKDSCTIESINNSKLNE